mmetsp:Transcript_21654/g.56433  ORF Transcript_21654/g.56433 Transcript_21654/m.56433 type:complete len:205 (-) Transcript_21654:1070-1684(-)
MSFSRLRSLRSASSFCVAVNRSLSSFWLSCSASMAADSLSSGIASGAAWPECRRCCRLVISSCSCRICALASTTWLSLGALVTRLACCAKLMVDRVLSSWPSEGEMVQIMAVRVLPPSAGCSMRVNLESRKRMCFPLVFSLPRSRMTVPSVSRLLLMWLPSTCRRRSPSSSATARERSDPARSTNVNVELITLTAARSAGRATR